MAKNSEALTERQRGMLRGPRISIFFSSIYLVICVFATCLVQFKSFDDAETLFCIVMTIYYIYVTVIPGLTLLLMSKAERRERKLSKEAEKTQKLERENLWAIEAKQLRTRKVEEKEAQVTTDQATSAQDMTTKKISVKVIHSQRMPSMDISSVVVHSENKPSNGALSDRYKHLSESDFLPEFLPLRIPPIQPCPPNCPVHLVPCPCIKLREVKEEVKRLKCLVEKQNNAKFKNLNNGNEFKLHTKQAFST